MKHSISSILFLSLVIIGSAAAEAPQIIFVSHNTSARASLEVVVTDEYNRQQRNALAETNPDAVYENVQFRDVPTSFSGPRLAFYYDLLDLEPEDPADKGFTDLLEAEGYNVYRSWTESETDPITGAVTRTFEFHPPGDRATADNYFLTQEQLDLLSSAELIIFSRDTSVAEYARGSENGTGTPILIEQWNKLDVPLISMNNSLVTSNEFNSNAWGWSYGFSGRLTSNILNRQDVPEGVEQFVEIDVRPKIIHNDASILRGIVPLDDGRVDMYMDSGTFPASMPTVPRKYSNNESFSYPEQAKVVLEFDVPSFFVAQVGEIMDRWPVIIRHAPNRRFFEPVSINPSRIVTPAAPRIYFAAGMITTGLKNLTPTGEQVFLNIVSEFVQPAGVTAYTVTFDLGDRGTRTGGGLLTQTVTAGGAAAEPDVAPDEGWEFVGWDGTFDNINADITITAQYEQTGGGFWAGLPVRADGTVETEAFGTVLPLGDFALLDRLAAWVYLPESFITENGAWIFGSGWDVLPIDEDGWFADTPLGWIHMDTGKGFLYIHEAGHWAYPAEHAPNGGRWVYLFADH